MRKMDVYYTEKQLAALKRLSDMTGLSMAEHIRRAVDYYLAREEFLDAIHIQTAEMLEQIS